MINCFQTENSYGKFFLQLLQLVKNKSLLTNIDSLFTLSCSSPIYINVFHVSRGFHDVPQVNKIYQEGKCKTD